MPDKIWYHCIANIDKRQRVFRGKTSYEIYDDSDVRMPHMLPAVPLR